MFSPLIHNRQSQRIKRYDYNMSGAYDAGTYETIQSICTSAINHDPISCVKPHPAHTTISKLHDTNLPVYVNQSVYFNQSYYFRITLFTFVFQTDAAGPMEGGEQVGVFRKA